MKRYLLAAAGVLLAIASVVAPSSAEPPVQAVAPCGASAGAATPPATYQHVIWIWMENKNYNQIVGDAQAPYLNKTVAVDCGLATNYYAASHPSAPNYLAATSGNTNNVSKDCTPAGCPDHNPSIFGQLSAAGMTWRSYAESMPSNCYKVAYPSTTDPIYVPRHNPATYYDDAAARCPTDDIPLGSITTGAFATDLSTNNLPNFAFVTPNTIDDMHSGTNQVANGDTWLSQWLPLITASPSYLAGNTAVFVTWDEGGGPKTATTNYPGEDCTANTSDVSCHVPTFVIDPYTAPGTTSSTRFTHYSLLRTTEEMLGLPLLDKAAAASSMRADFTM